MVVCIKAELCFELEGHVDNFDLYCRSEHQKKFNFNCGRTYKILLILFDTLSQMFNVVFIFWYNN